MFNDETWNRLAKLDETEKQKAAREERNRKVRVRRQGRDDAMRACGLTKVRGSVTGRIYWE